MSAVSCAAAVVRTRSTSPSSNSQYRTLGAPRNPSREGRRVTGAPFGPVSGAGDALAPSAASALRSTSHQSNVSPSQSSARSTTSPPVDRAAIANEEPSDVLLQPGG